jgi:beta-lactamase regulating signal transducer with metallopeptidase domain
MNALSVTGAPAWFDALINLSLQAAILAGLVWVILKAFGRWIPPNWRALMWFLVIARVLIPFAPASQFSLQNIFIKKTPPPAQNQFTASRSIQFPEPTDIEKGRPHRSPLATAFNESSASSRKSARTPIDPIQLLVFIWTAIAIFLLTLLVVRSLIIRRRLLQHGSPPPDLILELLAACRAQLRIRYPIRVTASDQIAAPALTGLIPARLIVPTAFAKAQFSSTQIRQILLHELAHIKQGHLLLHWLVLVARALQWFNPAIHFAANRLRHECELAADAAALKNSTDEERAAYGETILQVLANSVAPSTLLALGMADQARHLKQRLRALTHQSERTYHLFGIVLLCSLAVAGLSGATSKSEPERTSQTQEELKREYLKQTNVLETRQPYEQNVVRAPEQHFTRTFRVDPNTFTKGLEAVVPPIVPSQMAGGSFIATNRNNLPARVLEFFSAAGVDFPTNNVAVGGAVPGGFGGGAPSEASRKAIFFNDRTGVLFVRAPLRELDLVENAIRALNVKPQSSEEPPQLVMDSLFVTVSPKVMGELLGKISPLPTGRHLNTANEYINVIKDKPFDQMQPVLPYSKNLAANLKTPFETKSFVTESAEFIISPRQAHELRDLMESRSMKIVHMPSASVMIGRTGRQIADDAHPMLTPNAVEGQNVKAQLGSRLQFQALAVNESEIDLWLEPTMSEFVGYDPGSGVIPLPRFLVRTTQTETKVPRGSSLLLIVTPERKAKPFVNSVAGFDLSGLSGAPDAPPFVFILASPSLINSRGELFDAKRK